MSPSSNGDYLSVIVGHLIPIRAVNLCPDSVTINPELNTGIAIIATFKPSKISYCHSVSRDISHNLDPLFKNRLGLVAWFD